MVWGTQERCQGVDSEPNLPVHNLIEQQWDVPKQAQFAQLVDDDLRDSLWSDKPAKQDH